MDYYCTSHFFVPYNLVWSDWFEFYQDEFYYDVWF